MAKTDDDFSRGMNAGIIASATICVHAHGQNVIAGELLSAAGLTTEDEAKAAGADEYDLNILRPVFAALAR